MTLIRPTLDFLNSKIASFVYQGRVDELRNDVEDLLAGLDAGSIDYVLALKALKIQFLEGLKHPLVGAVDVKYTKMMIPVDRIDVPPALKKKKKPRRK